MTRDLDRELEDALNREASRTVRRDIEGPTYTYPMEGGIDNSKGGDRHKASKQIRVWVSEELYDQCKELVDSGVVASMSELVRKGMQMAFDEDSGYLDLVRENAARAYTEDQMTGFMNTGTAYISVNARWFAMHGTGSYGYLCDDINDDPTLNIKALEDKYGTPIVVGDKTSNTPTVDEHDGYRNTYAYRLEHDLLEEGE